MGGESQGQGLATKGLYSKLRHPMYYGFILWVLGLPIFMNSLFALASALIWIPQFLYWGISEEKELEKKHAEYKEYKKKTWF
jgi:protein-S-isoprenylcysteine O-methyltransferase Ste14